MEIEVIRIIFEVVLGGGWIVSLVNLRSTKKKSRAEALQAEMELGKQYVEEFTENIVVPLKGKVKQLETSVNGLKREMARLRKAINKSSSCQYVDTCPVAMELQKSAEDDRARNESESEADAERSNSK